MNHYHFLGFSKNLLELLPCNCEKSAEKTIQISIKRYNGSVIMCPRQRRAIDVLKKELVLKENKICHQCFLRCDWTPK